jgi:acyl-coenzyme A thioesterase PaaI-like protein
MTGSSPPPPDAPPGAGGRSLQETWAPGNACFGCGPANEKGLKVRSIVKGDEVVAEWRAEPHHEAFPGILNGGIIGALLDCHSNWTAAWTLMQRTGAASPPCTVTAEYAVRLLRPTPSGETIHLSARAVVDEGAQARDDRVVVEATLSAGGRICATCRGTFVAVEEGHPAFHRW